MERYEGDWILRGESIDDTPTVRAVLRGLVASINARKQDGRGIDPSRVHDIAAEMFELGPPAEILQMDDYRHDAPPDIPA